MTIQRAYRTFIYTLAVLLTMDQKRKCPLAVMADQGTRAVFDTEDMERLTGEHWRDPA